MTALTALEHSYVAAATRGELAEARRLEALIDKEQAEKETRLAAPTALKDAATWYATTLHLPVFPCTPGGKRPTTPHGFHDATLDPDQIRAWWAATPQANIGAPTGVLFDAIDVDGPEGVIALGAAVDFDGWPGGNPPIGWALTPHGMHRFITPTGLGNTTGMFPSVDYRGKGGYVILPPSRTPDGTYTWYEPVTPAVSP